VIRGGWQIQRPTTPGRYWYYRPSWPAGEGPEVAEIDQWGGVYLGLLSGLKADYIDEEIGGGHRLIGLRWWSEPMVGPPRPEDGDE
jgi:hypothetical protein